MTEKDTLTTDDDPDQTRHRAMLMGLIWLSVYPLVTISTYLLSPFDMPTFIKTFCTTLATVPVITFLVVPNAKYLIAWLDPKA